MTALAKSELFFLVTTIAVVFVSAGILVVVFYLVRILRDVKEIAEIAKTQAKQISNDADELRARIKRGGSHWVGIGQALMEMWTKRKGRKRNSK